MSDLTYPPSILSEYDNNINSDSSNSNYDDNDNDNNNNSNTHNKHKDIIHGNIHFCNV